MHGRALPGEKPRDFRATARRLLRFFGREKRLLLLALLMIAASAALNAVAPTVMGRAITEHLERSLDLPLFFRQMLLLLGIYLGAFLSQAGGTVAVNVISNRIIFRLRRQAFDHVQRLAVAYFDRVGIGDVISRLTNDVETVYHFISNGLASSLNGLFSILAVLIAMMALNLPMTLVLFLIVPVLLVIVRAIGKVVRKAAAERQRQVGVLSAAIEESVSGMKVIQSFHREEQERRKFDQINRAARDASIAMESSSYMMMPAMQLVNGLALVLVLGFGGAMAVLNPAVYSVGLVAAFLVYSRRFMQPLQQISNVYNLFNSALAGAERIFEVFDSREEIAQPDRPLPADRIAGHVEFRSVSFGYTADRQVLRDICLEAHPGELTAIVGPTGAGKTTIINLLCRFYDVDQGEIRIDGADIRHYDVYALRAAMGVVLQEPFFFAATIRENLLYGRPDASEDQMVEAARTANAHHFVSCLPKGYDTELTERGMNLSQGERQLLGIARTLLADPRILILDEATSSVDSLTERHIQQAVGRLMQGRTSFVIAHRLSTIRRADRLLVLHDRRIVERGTHEQLMAAGGFYSRLYALQFQRPEVFEDSFDPAR
ncbi:MAG: ABC transporter ATP-binding protein [Spirochaetales bacterium]|nr:ABC transporter ATP-binding protein [Spirochaetales bacterium]